jgi:hypothetical protein
MRFKFRRWQKYFIHQIVLTPTVLFCQLRTNTQSKAVITNSIQTNKNHSINQYNLQKQNVIRSTKLKTKYYYEKYN